jgi:hypothetical protein
MFFHPPSRLLLQPLNQKTGSGQMFAQLEKFVQIENSIESNKNDAKLSQIYNDARFIHVFTRCDEVVTWSRKTLFYFILFFPWNPI